MSALARLIAEHRGDATDTDLEARTAGRITAGRWRQLATRPLESAGQPWAPSGAIAADIAAALDVPVAAVQAAIAASQPRSMP